LNFRYILRTNWSTSTFNFSNLIIACNFDCHFSFHFFNTFIFGKRILWIWLILNSWWLLANICNYSSRSINFEHLWCWNFRSN
jgi:hypothetical protein